MTTPALSRYQIELIARAAAVEEVSSGGDLVRADRLRLFANLSEATAPEPMDTLQMLRFEAESDIAIAEYWNRHGRVDLPVAFDDLLEAMVFVRELRHRVLASDPVAA